MLIKAFLDEILEIGIKQEFEEILKELHEYELFPWNPAIEYDYLDPYPHQIKNIKKRGWDLRFIIFPQIQKIFLIRRTPLCNRKGIGFRFRINE